MPPPHFGKEPVYSHIWTKQKFQTGLYSHIWMKQKFQTPS